MSRKKYLLTGIDFSAGGKEALKFSYEYCRKSGLGLEIFHLFEFPVIYSNSGLYFVDYKEIKKNDEERLRDEVFKTIPEGGPVDVKIQSSFLSLRTFTDALKKNKSRYVAMVLGYHSRKGLMKRLNQSSGVRLSGSIDLPLFVVKNHEVFQVPESNRNAVILVDNKKMVHKSWMEKAYSLLSPLNLKIEWVHIHTDDEWPDIYEYDYTKDFKKWNVQEIRARDFESGLRKISSEKCPEIWVVLSEKHGGIYKLFRSTHTEKTADKMKYVMLSLLKD